MWVSQLDSVNFSLVPPLFVLTALSFLNVSSFDLDTYLQNQATKKSWHPNSYS